MKHLKAFESFSIEKLYHGNRKGDFPPKFKRFCGAIFLTSNLGFAKNFAGFGERDQFPDGGVWEVILEPNLKMCNPMEVDTMKKMNLKDIIQKMIDDKYVDPTNGSKFQEVFASGLKGFDYESDKEFDIKDKSESVYHYLWRVKNGSWRILETEPIIKSIKDLKFDGFYVVERGSKNVAIFDENSIQKFEKIL